jgi:hypothetical protein
MHKSLLIFCLIATFNVSGQFGQFASAVFVNNCGSSKFFNTTGSGANCINPTCGTVFNGTNYGSFNQNSAGFSLKGGEIKTWKFASGNVCSARLNYVVYTTGARPGSPVFTAMNLPFKCGCNGATFTFTDGLGPCSGSDQKWSIESNNINLTTRPPGNYTLEIYYDYSGGNTSSTCDVPLYINNGGNPTNYTATFTIVSSGGTCALLPVELLNFSYDCQSDLEFSWSTASEHDNDYFVLEKSIDAKDWIEVSRIRGKGNSSSKSDYSHSTDLSSVYQYYRLKQVDLNGNFEYFDPVFIECKNQHHILLEIYPNPITENEKLNLIFHIKKRVGIATLNMLDINGRIVLSKIINVENGINKFTLEEHFSRGIYFIQILNESDIFETEKFIVE